MNGLTSTNWNNSYGMENPKNILNKVISHGALPINQNYVFFNNGATRFINDSKLTPEIKKALEDERIKRGRGPIHGSGTIRPIGFTEAQMSDLFYNSYGLDVRISSVPPPIDPLTIALLTTGVGSLVQLIAAMSIYYILLDVLRIFSSSASFQLPKLGFSDFYGYEEKPVDPKSILKIINRNYPLTNDGELPNNRFVNLSSQAAFKKITGNSSYDTTLSKYQFNGGGGFSTDLRGEQMKKYIDNLLGNLTIEKSQINKLKKFFPKDSAAIETAQQNKKALLEIMKTKTNLGKNYIHADFLDYVPVLLSSRQKGYPNKEKEKSIFGPYICRSKRTYLYYPKIIVSTGAMSTLSSPQFSSMEILNLGVTVFGGYPDFFSTATYEDLGQYMGLVIRIASFGRLPMLGGACNVLNKDQAFNLGAAFNQKTQFKAKSDGC
jgi:hypothetical protein